MFRTLIAGIGLLGLVTAAGFRHQGNPEQRIDFMAQKLSQTLALRADQQPAFEALVAQAKQNFETRRAATQGTREALKAELANDTIDADKVGDLAKQIVAAHASDTQITAFIDQVAAFYKTLDPAQQKAFSAHLRDHFHHFE